MMRNIAHRHSIMQAAANPLPGSRPRDNSKPLNIPGRLDRLPLLAALCAMVPQVASAEWLDEFANACIVDWEGKPVEATRVVRAGQRFRHIFPAVIEPDVNARVEILHEEESLIVVNKPAPLPMHEGGRYYRNTLQYLLNEAYSPQRPLIVHRLDANTTGVVVVARTRHFAARLQTQFIQGTVEKTYLVKVQGQPREEEFSCIAPISSGAGELCVRKIDWQNGLPAMTEFTVLQRNADGTSLLRAVPLTGRTNQIRLHLYHLGYPVIGETVYRPHGQTADTQTLGVTDPPLCLHAWHVSFAHPVTGTRLAFSAAPPDSWAAGLEGA
jgi:RluA family pseudouridine synthase